MITVDRMVDSLTKLRFSQLRLILDVTRFVFSETRQWVSQSLACTELLVAVQTRNCKLDSLMTNLSFGLRLGVPLHLGCCLSARVERFAVFVFPPSLPCGFWRRHRVWDGAVGASLGSSCLFCFPLCNFASTDTSYHLFSNDIFMEC